MKRQYKRIPHKFTAPLQTVKVLQGDKFTYGLIIAKIHKLPKSSTIEEPYYLITGIGQPIWENHITPVEQEEYDLNRIN